MTNSDIIADQWPAPSTPAIRITPPTIPPELLNWARRVLSDKPADVQAPQRIDGVA